MEQFYVLQQQLGLMAWPLIICSTLTVMVLAERLIQVFISLGVGRHAIQKELNSISATSHQQIEELARKLAPKRPLVFKGVAMVLAHHSFGKTLREDAAGMWLQEKRHQLNSGLRLLSLIGVISPLIGLLGTVLGLIEMFKGVAASTGNITPNDLAEGLGLAMRTTAAGLLIALPAIAGAQLLGLWADRVMAKLEHTMNYANLWLEGIGLEGAGLENIAPEGLVLSPDGLENAHCKTSNTMNLCSAAQSVSSKKKHGTVNSDPLNAQRDNLSFEASS